MREIWTWETKLNVSSPVTDAAQLRFRFGELPEAPYYSAAMGLVEHLSDLENPLPYDIPGHPAAVRERASRELLARESPARMLAKIAREVPFIMNVDDDLRGAVVANRPLSEWRGATDVGCRILSPGSGLWDLPDEVARSFAGAGDSLMLLAHFPADDTLNAYSDSDAELAKLSGQELPTVTFEGAHYVALEEFLAQCDVTFEPGTRIHLMQEDEFESTLRHVDEVLVTAGRRREQVSFPHTLEPAIERCRYDGSPEPSDVSPEATHVSRSMLRRRDAATSKTPRTPRDSLGVRAALGAFGFGTVPPVRRTRPTRR